MLMNVLDFDQKIGNKVVWTRDHMLGTSRRLQAVQKLPPLFLCLFCIDLGHVLAEEKVDI